MSRSSTSSLGFALGIGAHTVLVKATVCAPGQQRALSASKRQVVGLENSMQCLTCGYELPGSGEGVEDRVGGLSRGDGAQHGSEVHCFLALHQLRVGRARTMPSGIAES
jgi:hypothetical protein